MTSILGAATKMIAAVTIVLAVVYALFLYLVRPMEPNPDAPTFADVQERLRAGETADADIQVMMEMQRELSAADPEDRQAIRQRMLEYQQQRALENMQQRMNQ